MAKEKNAEAQETALAVHEFKALAKPATELAQLMRDTAGVHGFSVRDLEKIKVPAGGGRTWEIETLKGIESVQMLEGIILHFKEPRAYWDPREPDSKVPTCFSDDSIHGIGKPGVLCDACPLNQFGTAVDAKGKPTNGKACKERRLLLFLRKESLLPVIIALPVTSIPNSKKYLLRVINEQLDWRGITTQIRLDPTKSAGGDPYSVATFTMGRVLSKEEQANAMQMAMTFKDMFAKVRIQDMDATDVRHV